MGYSTPTDSKIASIHRMLIQGPPNSGKTHSVCQTWPRPLHIVVAPGEKGDATIPLGIEGIVPHIWMDDPIEKMASGAIVKAVEELVWNILGGKHGPVASFCFDGFHKYYGYVLDWISGGALFKGEELGGGGDQWASARIYNRAREHTRYFVQRVNASPVENAVWLCWDGKEADDPGKKGSAFHIFPNLPGAAAKEFMGEFGIVVHSRIQWGMRQPKSPAPAKWQLIPEGDVWGAAIKAPIQVIEKLPVYCDQSYVVLKKLLEDAWQSGVSVTPAVKVG